MKRIWAKSGLVSKYSIVFYGIMLLLTAGLTVLMLYFASEKFVNYELSNVREVEIQAVNDVEAQYGVMRDVATQIRASSEYRPSVLYGNPYRDIELLNDFKRFSNYSPLIETYFLLYHDSNRMYTSDGKISYFEYYSSSVLGLNSQSADEFYRRINELKAETTVKLNEKVLFLFPVRFVNEEINNENAVLCFLLSESSLTKRVIPSRIKDSELIALDLGGVAVCGTNETLSVGTIHEEGDSYLVTARSDNGFAALSCRIRVSRSELLLSALPAWLYIGMILLVLLVALVGVLFGRMIINPIRSLVKKYISPGDYIRDELEELDGLISRIEAENHDSRRLLRDRTLTAILQGYYSKQLMERWGFLNLSFDHETYQVAVFCGSDNEEDNSRLLEQLEIRDVERVTVYSCRSLTGNVLAVMIGFDDEQAHQLAIDRIRAAIGEDADIFFGKEYTSAQRISASYLEAINEMNRIHGVESTDWHCFVTRLIAFSREGKDEEMRMECEKLCELYDTPSAHVVHQIALTISAELAAAAAEKHTDLNKDSLSALIVLSDLALCLSDTVEIVKQSFPYCDKTGGGKAAKLSEDIIDFIRENAFDPDLDLQKVAERFQMSGDYISTVVKAASGQSFKEYLTAIRMTEAGKLLREQPQLTVNEVSSRVGYRKVSNFIKKFKDVHGVTPSQYR